MTTRAEEIAGDGPYKVIEVPQMPTGPKHYRITGPTKTNTQGSHKYHAVVRQCSVLNASYKQGQQDARSLVQPSSSAIARALERIAEWDEHDVQMSIDLGSNGVRDYYRRIAIYALAAHPKDPAPTVERIMEVVTEVLQDSYGDDVLDWIERRGYTDKDSGITQRIEAKLMNP